MDNEDRKRWSAEYARANGIDAETPRSYPAIPPRGSLIARPDQRTTANITPRCIVESYLYADVAIFPGPGKTGKTTLAMWEVVHIVLGRPLYGLQVHAPGPVVFITAEDGSDLLFSRLCAVMEGMGLSTKDQDTVWASVEIWDVSGVLCRLAEQDKGNNVVLTGLADAVVERFANPAPVLVVFDPLISFGAGERLVNDNEHALIQAGRHVVRGLVCCVRFICHTGQQAAREGVIDQYAARGGSALSDGARMVAVLRAWAANSETDKLTPPIGFTVGSGESAMVLARPVCSYAPPQPLIWLKRRGWEFEYFVAARSDPEADACARADQLERYLIEKYKAGFRFTQNMLQDMGDVGMKRKPLRDALATLRATRRVVLEPLPEEERQGGRKNYLHPAKVPTAPDTASARGPVAPEDASATEPPPPLSTTAPPLRKREYGAVVRADPLSLFAHCAGQQLAQFGAVGAVEGNDCPEDLTDPLTQGPDLTPFDEAVRRKAAAEPGYSKDAAPRYCSECVHLAPDKRCLAWEQLHAPEGWKPADKAPRRCRGFVCRPTAHDAL